jgi:LPS export ABC transporter protein LptC
MRLKVSIAAGLTLAVWLSAGCGGDEGKSTATKSELPDEILVQFVTEETDSGRLSWRLSAPKATRYINKKVFLMTNPRIEFYDEAGILRTTLVSEQGEYLQGTRDMLAYGNVVVTTVDGDVLETDSLRYLNKEDKIVSDSFVKLTRHNDVITGYGLEADNRLNSVDIKRDVRARIIDDDGQTDE